ncbi:MAG: hypothetical protein O7H41_11540 [Planctomycetota bacterium]|nr:hypothetical protein [Planctomycetota bacterium]
MILILSNKWDLSADLVVRELRARRCPYVRVNTEDLADHSCSILLPDFRISLRRSNQVHDLTRDVTAVWNRRLGKPFDDVPKEAKPREAVQRFVTDQWYAWLSALQLIPGVTWMNHPQANERMEIKPRQLLMAHEAGFRIPDTLISNDPAEIRAFLRQQDTGSVAKALYSPLIEEPEEDRFVFTSEVRLGDLEPDTELRLSPTIFQKKLHPKVDYRVTVVGESVFVVRILIAPANSEALDWRTLKDGISFERCSLPGETERLCRDFVKQCGLLFGAIDLVQSSGEYIFLEINPNGEWGWLQKPHNVPIASAICDLLMSHAGS